ncbi:MAG: VIT1/CCC1 transporter family protein [Chloroflexi bacterium]|nr:VIT1/CCC1 transporter family protein [Chloroflexota bacterium]MBI3733201.1 VIT1/CCC1 transporter family protein [Chloroflexota bacterium]
MWHKEWEAAQAYRLVAKQEKDERRRGILTKLAEVEEGHAADWAAKITALGGQVPNTKPSLPASLRLAPADVILQKMEQEEEKNEAAYHKISAELADDETRALISRMAREEDEHAHTLRRMAPAMRTRSVLESILGRERWHLRGGSWIGDAIYGVNDGLGAVFGIVSGVAGATKGSQFVLVAGLAGMIASAISMGSGAYLAAKSEREVYEAELSREKDEIEANPEEEREEMELFYQLKGFSEEESKTLVARIQQHPEQFLKTLAHEELGLSATSFPNPWKALVSSMLSTAVGAFIPLIPFFFAVGYPAVAASLAISIAAHFAVGAAKSLVTARSWWASGLEMTVVGIIAGVITFALGTLFGGIG